MDARSTLDYAIRQYHKGALESSAHLLEEAVTLSRQEGLIDTELLARNNLCEAYCRLGMYEQSLECAYVLLATSRSAGLRERQGDAILSLSMALQAIDLRGRWDELKAILIEGLEIAREIGDRYNEIMVMEILGRCYIRLALDGDGLNWLQKALNNIHPSQNEGDFFRTRIYQGLSDLGRLRKDPESAIRYAELAIGLAESINSPHLIISTKLTLAQAERSRGERAVALKMVEEVLFWAKHERWKIEEQLAEYLRSELGFELGYYDISLAAAIRALSLAQEMKLMEEEVRNLIILGKSAYVVGQYDTSLDAYNQARSLSKDRHYDDYLLATNELIKSSFPSEYDNLIKGS